MSCFPKLVIIESNREKVDLLVKVIYAVSLNE